MVVTTQPMVRIKMMATGTCSTIALALLLHLLRCCHLLPTFSSILAVLHHHHLRHLPHPAQRLAQHNFLVVYEIVTDAYACNVIVSENKQN